MANNSSPPFDLELADRKFSIGRMLVISAGVAVGVTLYRPEEPTPDDLDWWFGVFNALLLGAALPAPWFVLRLSRRLRMHTDAGSYFAMSAGLGAWILTPPALVADTALACLYYAIPLWAVWFSLGYGLSAWLVRGGARRPRPWTDWYGLILAWLWLPLGMLHLCHFYSEAFGDVDFFHFVQPAASEVAPPVMSEPTD